LVGECHPKGTAQAGSSGFSKWKPGYRPLKARPMALAHH
jgi:hypothetical protein